MITTKNSGIMKSRIFISFVNCHLNFSLQTGDSPGSLVDERLRGIFNFALPTRDIESMLQRN